jgi:hypothetical protein
MINHVYAESSLQLAAVDWLSKHSGYSEIISDHAAVGDLVDSVGVMAGRAVLIEVKPKIYGGSVRHAARRPGTIESKIARALKNLHDGEQDRVSRALRACWDRARPPVFAILARGYSAAGRHELKALLEQRSREWLFDYRVWQWTGSEVEELGGQNLAPCPHPADYDLLKIDQLSANAFRNKARTLDEFRTIADARGVGPLFRYALTRSRALGYSCRPMRGNLCLKRANPEGKSEFVVGLYIEASSAEFGMNVGVWLERTNLSEPDLPGKEAPRKGHLNTNRYLQTMDEVEFVLQLFSGR